MDGPNIVLVALLGVVSCSHVWISRSALEVTVRPGENITIYCDCKLSTAVYIVWYRNCTHNNQPSLVLQVKHGLSSLNFNVKDPHKIFPHFDFLRNFSSESYDLLITNVTASDEGLYYCGTEETILEYEEQIIPRTIYRYGNVTTRILFNSSECISNPVVSWMMVFTPAFTILSSFISFILVYHFCQNTDKEPRKFSDTRKQTRLHEDEDVYFTHVVFEVTDGQTPIGRG